MNHAASTFSVTISMRGKIETTPVMKYLSEHFPYYACQQIDSVFGFVERSTLYGGRPFLAPELSQDDVQTLYARKLGLRLPVSNDDVSREEFDQGMPFLEKYHLAGNTLIVTNDSLARWARQRFPKYHIEASAIKNIDNLAKLSKALDDYDTVVLPAKCNDDCDFLAKIEDKARVRLFLNAGCAYNCPSKMCYPSVSQMNKYQGAEFRCSQPLIKREVKMHNFDANRFMAMGFSKFKVLRAGPVTGY